ncbi:MAG TPA: hypothetical protein VGG61_14945 [Gemmataceae bacterium]|jgi:hypothetical protein
MAKPISEAKLIQIPAQTVDDFGDVVRLREQFAPTERLYNRLRDQIKELCRNQDPTASYLMRGERWTLKISPCTFESQVDVAAARKKLGAEKFLSACSITLRALANLLPKPEVDALTVTVRTSTRTFTPVAVAAAVEKADAA